MEELVKYIVGSIVEDKEAVKVTLKEDKDVTVIEVSVAENDMGKVIGKNGKTASALSDKDIEKIASRLQGFGSREIQQIINQIIDKILKIQKSQILKLRLI